VTRIVELSTEGSITMSFTKREFLKIATGAAALPLFNIVRARAQSAPDSIGIDYAYYNPVSLLLKKKGWFEEEFSADGIGIRWVLSLGSNKALEYLRGSSIEFGSSAGSAALVARAGGLPIKSVYAYSQPEWTALVTRKDAGITKVEDLKGKSVAVTRGTDPHIFLLRALDSVGLSENDINPVLLQHPDGYRALASNQVDAWAGLDPHMAKAELESDAVLFYRNTSFNTYGILNVSQAFAEANPELVRRVLAVYERGRKYALDNPDELRAELVEVASVSDEVARIQLSERTDLSEPAIGDAHRETLLATGEVLKKIGFIDAGADVASTVEELVDPSYLEAAAG
jgi:sulfonate transport system substrate-binding protein